MQEFNIGMIKQHKKEMNPNYPPASEASREVANFN
jgi:hypothetical protein